MTTYRLKRFTLLPDGSGIPIKEYLNQSRNSYLGHAPKSSKQVYGDAVWDQTYRSSNAAADEAWHQANQARSKVTSYKSKPNKLPQSGSQFTLNQPGRNIQREGKTLWQTVGGEKARILSTPRNTSDLISHLTPGEAKNFLLDRGMNRNSANKFIKKVITRGK